LSEITLESLARRVQALEVAVAKQSSGGGKDWRKVVGMFHDSEFMREVDEECQRMREEERKAARAGEDAIDSH
jgi:hypothetical protein